MIYYVTAEWSEGYKDREGINVGYSNSDKSTLQNNDEWM